VQGVLGLSRGGKVLTTGEERGRHQDKEREWKEDLESAIKKKRVSNTWGEEETHERTPSPLREHD